MKIFETPHSIFQYQQTVPQIELHSKITLEDTMKITDFTITWEAAVRTASFEL